MTMFWIAGREDNILIIIANFYNKLIIYLNFLPNPIFSSIYENSNRLFLILIIATFFYTLKQLFLKYLFRKHVSKTDFLFSAIAIFSFSIIIYGLTTAAYFIDNPSENDGKLECIGTLGDLIGGVLNPVIAVPATLLTFLAFWVQYRANDEVRKQFETQKFETEFNLKLSILRQEISEQNLPKLDKEYYTGREIMYQLDKELKLIYFIVKNSISTNDSRLILKISYYIFFKGRLLFFKNINELASLHRLERVELLNVELILSSLYSYFKYDVIDVESVNSYVYAEEGAEDNDNNGEELTIERISDLKRGLENNLKIHDVLGEYESSIVYNLFNDLYSLNLKHLPFKGHETRLSLIFRQIFNIVKFVNLNTSLSYDHKRSYLRTLRSILSNYDQSHIFYNWYSETAPKWEDNDNKYLTDFRMIHNISPDNLIEDFDLNIIFSNRNFKYESNRKASDSLFENIHIYSNSPY